MIMKDENFDKSKAMKIRTLRVRQPIGDFYVGVMSAREAVEICSANRRQKGDSDQLEDYVGIQRPLSSKRVEEIKKYVKTWDATFPNSIILAVNPGYYSIEDGEFYILKDKKSANIIDGQHRLAGFEDNVPDKDFEVIVTFFPDLELDEQAYIFSVINTKMTRINPSLAQDLYAFAKVDIPGKLAHNIAVEFNRDVNNPWHGKIKMLGTREPGSDSVLSQSTFAREIVDLICNPKDAYEIRNILTTKKKREALKSLEDKNASKHIFWNAYVEGNDKFIYTVLKNYFSAVEKTFPDAWADIGKILVKTTGYGALMKVFKAVYLLGYSDKDLTEIFFKGLFEKAKNSGELKDFNSTNYNPGKVGEGKLADDFLKGMALSSNGK